MTYLPHSKAYPYIVLNVLPVVYRIFRPGEIDGNDILVEASKLQNKYKNLVCAVFASDRCVYLELDGSRKFSDNIPAGGFIIDPFEI